MGKSKREWRGDQLYCRGHGEWHHHGRFQDHKAADGSICRYDLDCKLFQQTKRVEAKNVDLARATVEGRAKEIVRKANEWAKATGEQKINLEFVMYNLNYRSLIPMVRAYLVWGEESLCPNCGSPYDSKSTLHFDHREPPRNPRDWARLHARNIGPLDKECNTPKNDMAYAKWLDVEETKRLNAEEYNRRLAEPGGQIFNDRPAPPGGQMDLFGDAA